MILWGIFFLSHDQENCYLGIKFLCAPFISPVEYNRGISSPTDGSTEKKNARNERKRPLCDLKMY